MTVDLAKLRALYEAAEADNGLPFDHTARGWLDWVNAILDAAPALFSELEALRAEVERLRSAPTTIPKCHRCAERS